MHPKNVTYSPASDHNLPQLMSRQGGERHPILIRLMHWLTAVVISGMLVTGFFMVRTDDANPWKYDKFYVWHQSIGIVALLLINLRLFIRLRVRLSPLPSSMSRPIVTAANVVYFVMYLLMFGIPLAGIVMSAAYPQGQGLVFFTWTMPSFLSPNEATFNLAKTVHWLLAYVFACLIVLHALATLRHRFLDRPEHNVLARML
jgi:cytochrome b561